MPLHKSIRWRSLQHGGFEQLQLDEGPDGFTIRSTVIGDIETAKVGVFYQLSLLPDWTVSSIELQRTDGAVALLKRASSGVWCDAHGERSDLAGCVDIDFEMTPFTNTLPIRRAPLAIGETRRFRMAYVPAKTLEPFADEQIYTRLDEHRYRFEEADGSFSAEIIVDGDGFVTHYPQLFETIDAGLSRAESLL